MREAKITLVFDGLNQNLAELQQEFLNFLIDLANSTENLKMVIVINSLESIAGEMLNNFETIEISFTTESQAIEYLMYLAHTEKKI